MHGRLKVRTTEEQKIAKEVERQKKLKIYQSTTQTIFKIRGDSDKEDEILKLTKEVLSQNPDFHTLWNIRKEIFSKWKNDGSDATKMIEFVATELSFIEHCLKTNPKSYGAWGHRCFILSNIPNPNWDREVVLTSLFLEYDDRNFHCWDYRRYLAKQAKLSHKCEFEFSTKKIEADFSNFSSWHYRGCLLPLVYPGPHGKDSIEDSILNNEFDLIKNAFFTDPNDQTAWFYHRFLLHKSVKRNLIESVFIDRKRHTIIVSFSRPACAQSVLKVFVNDEQTDVNWISDKKFDYIATGSLSEILFESAELRFKILTNPEANIIAEENKTNLINSAVIDKGKKVDSTPSINTMVDAETCEVSKTEIKNAVIIAGEMIIDDKMNDLDENVKSFTLDNDQSVLDENSLNIKLEPRIEVNGQNRTQDYNRKKDAIINCDNETSESDIKDNTDEIRTNYRYGDLGFGVEEINCLFSQHVSSIRECQPSYKILQSTLLSLQNQIDEIKQLYEIEPVNKWVMHALLALMLLTDSAHYYNECIGLLEKMKILDPMRINFYNNFESKVKIVHQIERLTDNCRSISLSSLELTNLHHLHRISHLRSVNLSDNYLVDVSSCRSLKCVELLVLKRNRIKRVDGVFNLPHLNILDLELNEIEDLNAFSTVSNCPQLHTLILSQNPIIKLSNLSAKIREIVTTVTIVEI